MAAVIAIACIFNRLHSLRRPGAVKDSHACAGICPNPRPGLRTDSEQRVSAYHTCPPPSHLSPSPHTRSTPLSSHPDTAPGASYRSGSSGDGDVSFLPAFGAMSYTQVATGGPSAPSAPAGSPYHFAYPRPPLPPLALGRPSVPQSPRVKPPRSTSTVQSHTIMHGDPMPLSVATGAPTASPMSSTAPGASWCGPTWTGNDTTPSFTPGVHDGARHAFRHTSRDAGSDYGSGNGSSAPLRQGRDTASSPYTPPHPQGTPQWGDPQMHDGSMSGHDLTRTAEEEADHAAMRPWPRNTVCVGGVGAGPLGGGLRVEVPVLWARNSEPAWSTFTPTARAAGMRRPRTVCAGCMTDVASFGTPHGRHACGQEAPLRGEGSVSGRSISSSSACSSSCGSMPSSRNGEEGGEGDDAVPGCRTRGLGWLRQCPYQDVLDSARGRQEASCSVEIMPLPQLRQPHSDGSVALAACGGMDSGGADEGPTASVSCMHSGEFLSGVTLRTLTSDVTAATRTRRLDASGAVTGRSIAASADAGASAAVPPAHGSSGPAAAPPPPAAAGQLQVHGNNQLQIFRLLGRGGYGTVFHGASPSLNSPATPRHSRRHPHLAQSSIPLICTQGSGGV